MIYEKTDNFFNQKTYLKNIREHRFEFFKNLCRGKKVMHVGCADSMVFNVETNLHIYLCELQKEIQEPEPAPVEEALPTEEHIDETALPPNQYEQGQGSKTIIHGLDIDADTTAQLQEACPGTYFTSYDQVKEEYDLVLVPEVMEHVPNVELFLKDVFSIISKEYIITVPSAHTMQLFCDDEFALEMVHPDHKYWFSPYTLYNTIKPFAEQYNMQMFYLENKSQVAIRLCEKPEEVEEVIEEQQEVVEEKQEDLATEEVITEEKNESKQE